MTLSKALAKSMTKTSVCLCDHGSQLDPDYSLSHDKTELTGFRKTFDFGTHENAFKSYVLVYIADYYML